MQRKVENTLPLVTLLTPDEDFAIIACRCEDVAVFWMCPRDAPDCSFVSTPMCQLNLMQMYAQYTPSESLSDGGSLLQLRKS